MHTAANDITLWPGVSCGYVVPAAERERSANEKAANASARQVALVAALEAAREEASEARAEAEAAKDALMNAQAQLRRLEEQLKQVPGSRPCFRSKYLQTHQIRLNLLSRRPIRNVHVDKY